MRSGSTLHPIARSLLAAATAVALGASPALAGGPDGDDVAASPTAEVSSSPTVGSTPSPTAEDSSGASPTPSSEPSDDASPGDAGPWTPSPSNRPKVDREARAGGRALAQAAGFAAVGARDNRFVPVSITVQAGTTVVWENEGRAPHTVTANDRAFDSGTLDPGQRFQVTFDEVGTVPYYCQIHGEPNSGMTGVVRVVAAAETPDERAPSVGPNELPRTGSGAVALALLAFGLAVAGSLALRAGVRRGRG